MTGKSDCENQREFFRIKFPAKEMPTLFVDGTNYEIIDVSEKGVSCSAIPGVEIDDEIHAVLHLRDNEPTEIEGRVVRVTNDCVAMILDKKGLPYQKIIEEQQRLIRKYGRRLPV